jgi:hypothetical protein
MKRPTQPESIPESLNRQSFHGGPLCKCMADPTIHDAPVVAPIVLLVLPVSPLTVSGFVVPVHVHAFQGKSSWAPAHETEKGRKRLRPQSAHGNAASAIVREPLVALVEASALSAYPGTILPSLTAPFGTPVRARCKCWASLRSVHVGKG